MCPRRHNQAALDIPYAYCPCLKIVLAKVDYQVSIDVILRLRLTRMCGIGERSTIDWIIQQNAQPQTQEHGFIGRITTLSCHYVTIWSCSGWVSTYVLVI